MSSSISTDSSEAEPASFGRRRGRSLRRPGRSRPGSWVGARGRRPGAEVELLEAALSCGAHVLLEGPPGTGKSTLLRSVASDFAVPYVLVEGNAELTPDPAAGAVRPRARADPRLRPRRSSPTGRCSRRCGAGACSTSRSSTGSPRRPLNVLLSAMSRAARSRAQARTRGRRPRVRVRRGDEPVRRGRHRAGLGGALRPDLPHRRWATRPRGRRTGSSRCAGSTCRRGGGSVPCVWCGPRASTPTSRSARRCAVRSTSRRLAVALAGRRGLPVEDCIGGAGGGERRAFGSDPAARRLHALGGGDHRRVVPAVFVPHPRTRSRGTGGVAGGTLSPPSAGSPGNRNGRRSRAAERAAHDRAGPSWPGTRASRSCRRRWANSTRPPCAMQWRRTPTRRWPR